MKSVSVRDLRYRFSRVETILREGQEIQLTKRRRVIARLVPQKTANAAPRPDFLARQHERFGLGVTRPRRQGL
ncbi:MAG: type II toxin-antitoxin system Phd/YefM family antitoxin [Terriglobia bacterium]